MRAMGVLILVLIASVRADAVRVLHHYDLDSLVSLSEAIIKAEVGEGELFKTRDGTCTIFDVKVLKSLKGDIASNSQVRVAGLDMYRYAPGIEGRTDSTARLGKGDVVYLFLTPVGERGYAMYRLTDAQWTIIESGVRLVGVEHVYAFSQGFDAWRAGVHTAWTPSGDFGAMTTVHYPHLALVTTGQFEEQVSRAQTWLDEIGPVLHGNADPGRVLQYMAILRERERTRGPAASADDTLGVQIALKLAEAAQPATIDSFRQEVRGQVRRTLDGALGHRPAGRAYLLRKLDDATKPEAARIEWAKLLKGTGWGYYLAVRDDGVDASPGFAGTAARIVAKDPASEVSRVLLEAIAGCAPGGGRAVPAYLAQDLSAAAEVLAPLYAAANEPTRFHIAQTLLQIDRAAYDRVLPDAGPLLIWVTPKPDFAEGVRKGELRMVCRYRNVMRDDEPLAQIRLVMRLADGGQERELPTDSSLARQYGRGETFGFAADLPADVPAGRYHVFYRVYQEGRRIGDGVGFDCDVPARP